MVGLQGIRPSIYKWMGKPSEWCMFWFADWTDIEMNFANFDQLWGFKGHNGSETSNDGAFTTCLTENPWIDLGTRRCDQNDMAIGPRNGGFLTVVSHIHLDSGQRRGLTNSVSTADSKSSKWRCTKFDANPSSTNSKKSMEMGIKMKTLKESTDGFSPMVKISTAY